MKISRILNYYGHSKSLRRSIFNTAGSFGYVAVSEGILGDVFCRDSAETLRKSAKRRFFLILRQENACGKFAGKYRRDIFRQIVKVARPSRVNFACEIFRFFFHRFWREILVCEIFRFRHLNPGERSTRKISHQNFTPNFRTPLAEKNREKIHSALLQG